MIPRIDTTREPKTPERAAMETIILAAIPLLGLTILASIFGNPATIFLAMVIGGGVGFLLGLCRKMLFMTRLRNRMERRTPFE